ncbi:hypothetical protein Hanom_Chr02g00103201 [Helianthus anomalus]
MSNNVPAIRKETEFALLAFMEIPSNIKQQLTTRYTFDSKIFTVLAQVHSGPLLIGPFYCINAQFSLLISKTWPLVVDIRHVTCAEKHLSGVQSKL